MRRILPHAPRRWARSPLGAVVLIVAIVACPAAPVRAQVDAGTAHGRPDVIVILTDDQRWDTLGDMPVVERALVGHGVTFENAFVTNPLCCPSRASLLTGLYSHNTGVYRQAPPYGGFASFDDRSTLATWLDDAGYSTAFVGKYIDAGQSSHLAGYVPPGWDGWTAFVHAEYYGYELSVNGSIQHRGDEPHDYSTDVLAARAVDFLRATDDPAFLLLAVAAPHAPALPAPRHAGVPVREWIPAPAFDEADVSDKPPWVRRLRRIGDRARAGLAALYQAQLRSLLAVDDAVAAVIRAQRERGRLHDTVFVFTSDNGLLFGEHRWVKKEAPYDESIRVPMVIRYDRVTSARVEPRMALNIDLAPTLADLAGVEPPDTDGTTLRPLLDGRADVAWRDRFLIEHLEGANQVTTYCAVRSERWLFVRYRDGFEEVYDVTADPFQLRNVADEVPDRRHGLAPSLQRLCDPEPPDAPRIDRPDGATPIPIEPGGVPVALFSAVGLAIGAAAVALRRRRTSTEARMRATAR
ncbi:MAG TPA: sulfatase [Actinomycetota bacterium]|nr:sulfatase [Actinomycetota bacterium]